MGSAYTFVTIPSKEPLGPSNIHFVIIPGAIHGVAAHQRWLCRSGEGAAKREGRRRISRRGCRTRPEFGRCCADCKFRPVNGLRLSHKVSGLQMTEKYEAHLAHRRAGRSAHLYWPTEHQMILRPPLRYWTDDYGLTMNRYFVQEQRYKMFHSLCFRRHSINSPWAE